MASHWGLSGAAGVLIPAELDWSVKLGPQLLPGIYKLGGSYDTASLSNWYTAINGVPLPLTTRRQRRPTVAPSTCLGSKKFGSQILIPGEESQS
jgi:carbohydrate-selective porin OprB